MTHEMHLAVDEKRDPFSRVALAYKMYLRERNTKVSFPTELCSIPKFVYSSDFSRFIGDAFEARSSSEMENTRASYGHGSRGSWRAGVAGCRKN